ncbi:MAG TPA: GAF domain-containing sensor histidine kinase [Solirubrobacteraceae bacterium]|nr:GAF domain-containing sensor histidine kinase [Solirubrobacteraceae bacterium]
MIDSASRRVLDLARSVLAELDVDVVLDRVLQAARELTGARYAALGVLDPSGVELERFVTAGVNERTRARIGGLPRGRGVLGELIDRPAPLRLEDVGAHPGSYGFPAGHPPMRTFLGVPIVIAGRAFGNLYVTEKQGGGQFTAEDEQAAVVLAEFAAVAVENAQIYGGAKHQRDELARTVATLEATTHVTRAVGGETDLAVVLEMVAKRGRALVSARSLVIELLNGDGHLTIAAGAGEWPQSMEGERVPLADTVAETALRTLQTQRLEDELNRARFNQHGLGRLGMRAEAGLAVPLVFNGRSHGVLLVIDRLQDGPRFTDGDVRLLEAFASSAATAVATAKSVATDRKQQRLAAAEAERARWARELHDETLQRLAALQIALSSARRSGRQESMEDAIDNARELLESEIANLRSMIAELRPPTLDELGLATALGALGDRATSQGMEVDVSVEMAPGLDGGAVARHTAELETAVYRLVQEALTNAAKHGHARRTVVEVQDGEGAVHVCVRDDGGGFDTSAQTDGFGLLGMRERVEMVDGDLQISSGSGGTTVNAVFPVRRGVRPVSVARAPALRVSALPSPR